MVAITSAPEHPVSNAGAEATNSVDAEVANHPESGAEATHCRTERCTKSKVPADTQENLRERARFAGLQRYLIVATKSPDIAAS